MTTTQLLKVPGYKGTVTIGGVDFQLTNASCKIEVEKNEYVALGSTGWVSQILGGVKKATGTAEFAFDDTLVSGTSNGLPKPLTDGTTLAAMVINIDTHSLSFNAAVYDWDLKKPNKGLTTVSVTYESDGPVTYA
jgi:hypothetical protein